RGRADELDSDPRHRRGGFRGIGRLGSGAPPPLGARASGEAGGRERDAGSGDPGGGDRPKRSAQASPFKTPPEPRALAQSGAGKSVRGDGAGVAVGARRKSGPLGGSGGGCSQIFGGSKP